ncbi:MAG TPA: carboxypeptidase regulatory-like domain-containing protein [Thermoanaerobaculia bacterium]|nr:carboxypeptidase regulatory-like domain-containing protein [Thermoanaerobaculia bacterium]
MIVSGLASFFLVATFAQGAGGVEKKDGKFTTQVLFPSSSKVTGLTPLRDHLKRPQPGATRKEMPIKPPFRANPSYRAPAAQPNRNVPAPRIPDPLLTFEGVGDANFVQPADTTLAIGPNHVFQWVNLSFQIFDKSGNALSAVTDGTSFWTDLGGDCANVNGGDIIVIYDHLADRWVATQLAAQIQGASTNNVCMAISTSPDPLGTYFQYDFDYGSDLNDYPKWAMWPDAYYGTFRNFIGGGPFGGMHVWAIDRNAILAGNPSPTILTVNVGTNYPNLDGLLAANLSPGNLGPPAARPAGGAVPAQTAPETLFAFSNPGLDGDPSAVKIFQFHVDFVNPGNSTFTGAVDVPINNYTPTEGSITQPSPGGTLEDLPWIMYKADYRNFGDHEGVVLTHTADEGGGVIGVNWYEVRDPRGTPTIFQQGIWSPDSTNRWFPSIAQDVSGDIAVGFSATDAATFPSIRYAGRLPSDPPGDMSSQGEGQFFAGSAAFGGFRWGDYSTINLDPVDQCTFWYTTMYIVGSGGLSDWSTGIGSFKFPSCTAGPSGTLEGHVTDGTNPLAGAKVTAGPASATTDATGHYSMVLPVGTYDMTASLYGYFPGSAPGVGVTDGGDTVQDFALSAAPSTNVNGTVKDAVAGWPLYAKVVVTAPGAPTFTMWTDPVTGYYSVTLVQGGTYTFAVTAVAQGYNSGGGSLPLLSQSNLPNGMVANWTLTANALSCNAPGYVLNTSGLFESFDNGTLPPGWTIQNNSTNGGNPWQIWTGPDPCGQFPGNTTGGSGPYALVNSNCDGFVTDDTSLITPSVDLSGSPNAIVRFDEDYNSLFDNADVDVSTDGGTTWHNVIDQTSSQRGPHTVLLDISAVAGGQPNVMARWHYYNAFFAWWWQVDDILVGSASCDPMPGGLVVGSVVSTNSGTGLYGATVTNLTSGGTTKTFATPQDPNQPNGLYILFSESGPEQLQATLNLYGSDTHTPLVIPNSTVRQDFSLASGNVAVTPGRFDARVDPPNGSTDMTMNLLNSGGNAANWQILEINAPAPPSSTHGTVPTKVVNQINSRFTNKVETLNRTSQGLPPLTQHAAPGRPLATGDVIASYPSGLAGGWGVLAAGADFWISNIAALGGDEHAWEYASATGTQTGNNIDNSGWVGAGGFAADGAYDVLTGMMWEVNVGGDNCIYELDPNAHQATGNKICGSPWTGTSQRGLAYDVINNAFFIGGWNQGIIYHIDINGNVIDSANLGLFISGLAYAPNSGHLLVMENAANSYDITVLDANNNYANLGHFQVNNNGTPAFQPFQQAGMEFDCLGNLWVINQATQEIFSVDSGENFACQVDIPWLTENPTSGTLSAAAHPVGGATPAAGGSNSQDVDLSFTGGTLLPGLRQAQLQIKTDTPVPVPTVPVTLTVRFLDVPDNNPFQAFIYGVAGAQVMFGGPPVCSDVLHFCPNGVVTRADMAGYLFRAVHGINTPPPVYQNIFGDVTFNDYNSFYIQGIFDDGITAGCGGGNFCPTFANTRAQMSVFIWKAQFGSTPPPACAGLFNDVPCPGGFAVDYIEALYHEGVTAGCGNNNYCPNSNITNGQMAVFLVKGFNLPVAP